MNLVSYQCSSRSSAPVYITTAKEQNACNAMYTTEYLDIFECAARGKRLVWLTSEYKSGKQQSASYDILVTCVSNLGQTN